MMEGGRELKLLLVDGTSVVRRVYKAVPGEEGPARADGTVTASLHSIQRALGEHRPTHFLAAFDHGGKNWRHELCPEYKSQREAVHPALRAAMPKLYGDLEGLGLRWSAPAGYEADDVIATLATRAAARGFSVVIASSDSDMAALLRPNIRVYSHFTSEWRDERWLFDRLGVAPDLVADLMGLVGDSKKSIPGIAQLGAKTASQLLAQYGDLEGVLSAGASIRGKIGERIRAHPEVCRLAKQLFTLRTDVPLSLRPSDLEIPPL